MKDKNKDIEFLRAMAIIFTLIVHLKTLLLYPFGWLAWVETHFELSIGVDLFFAISGFVITKSLSGSSAGGGVSRFRLTLAFWTRRFFRLFPAALFWLLMTAAFLATADALKGNLMPFVASVVNVFNIYNAYCVANMGGTNPCDYFIHGHYWSLSLEEQFYLAFPLLYFCVPRRVLLPLVIVGIALQFFWWRPIWSYGWFFRTDAILWGVLLALLPNVNRSPAALVSARWFRLMALVAGSGLLLILPYVGRQVIGFGETMKPYGVGLTALLSALLVWIASHDKDVFYLGNRLQKLMLYVGSRSYSLYVAHLIVYTAINNYARRFATSVGAHVIDGLSWNIGVAIVGVLVTFGLSEFTYRFVEMGLREKGRQYSRRILQVRQKSRESASPHIADERVEQA